MREVERRPDLAGTADDHAPATDARGDRPGSLAPGRRRRRPGRGAGRRAGDWVETWPHGAGSRRSAQERTFAEGTRSAERRGPPTSSVADRGGLERAARPRDAGRRGQPGERTAAPSTTSIVVPSPGSLVTRERARRPARPGRASRPARGGRRGRPSGSKPLPSSSTRRRTPPSSGRTSTRTCRAAACLTTLWSASWAMR